MNLQLTDDQEDLRRHAVELTGRFSDEYWAECDREARFPWEFYDACADSGWLGVCTPTAYGGHGLGIFEAMILMGVVAESGAGMNGASAIHVSIFGTQPVVLHGSKELKERTLPKVVAGESHVCFGVTEPDAGIDTSRVSTFAVRDGDHYVVSGRKVWISKAQVADKILLLTRTSKRDEVSKPTDGMTLFLADFDRSAIEVRGIRKLGRHAVDSNELFIDGLKIPVSDRVGEEGEGFRYLIDGLNPERILVGAEALGLGRAAIRRAVAYARERIVFDRPIGMNQGIQFPLADSLMRLDAAELVLRQAAQLFDQGLPCGREANTAKYLAAEAGFEAADRAVQVHGGMGYASEFHVERYFREARLPRIAPVSQEMVKSYIATHVLGLPRSY